MRAPFVTQYFNDHKSYHKNIDIIRYGVRTLYHWDDAVLIRPYWRFFWANKRGARFHHEGKTLELRPDALTVIPPYLEVGHEFFEEFDVFNVNVDIEKPFHSYPNIFEVPVGEETLETITDISQHPDMTDFRRQAQLQSLVLKVLVALDPSFFDLGSKNKKVVEVIRYMEDHLQDYLSNDKLADLCGMSTNSFIRLFSKETCISPQEYLRNIRLDASANLLLKTKMGVSDICQKCGFSERNYFSRVFAKRFKMGPVSYRKSDIG